MITPQAIRARAGESAVTLNVTQPRKRIHRFPLHVRMLAYAYLVSVPFEIDFVLGGRSLAFWLAAGLLFAALIQLPRLVSTKAVVNGRMLLAPAVLLGFCWMSYFWSIDKEATFAASTILLSTILTWLVLSMVLADCLGAAFWALIAGTSLMSLQLITSDVNIDGRADILADVNDVAVLIVLSGSWLLARLTRRATTLRKRIVYALLLGLHLWALLATGSRTGVLAALVPVALVIVWSILRLRLSLLLGVLLVVGLVGVAFILLEVRLPERIVEMPNALKAEDLNFREVVWRAAYPELFSILGTGLGTTPAYMTGILGVAAVMHSFYLGIALELGVAGLLIWSWFLIKLGAGLRDSPWTRELGMMCVSMLVMASTLSLEMRRPLWVLLALLGALSIYSRSPVRRSE